MGAAASSFSADLPERIDIATLEAVIARLKLNVHVDMIRFNLMKDKNETISRTQALQLIENKLPPIYSLNGLVAVRA